MPNAASRAGTRLTGTGEFSSNSHQTAVSSSRRKQPASFLPVSGRTSAVLGVVGAIALSCTDTAGRWCDHAFNSVFRRVLSDSGRAYELIHFVAEKSVHVTLFAGLSIGLWHCLKRVRHRTTCTLFAGFALGCCSELFQRLFPTRDPAIRDVLINWSSVMIGLAANHAAHALLRGTSARRIQADAAEDVTAEDLLTLSAAIRGSRVHVSREEACLIGSDKATEVSY